MLLVLDSKEGTKHWIASDSKERKKQVLCFFRFEGPRKQVLCFFWIHRAKETGVVFHLDLKGLCLVFENLKSLGVLRV